jgi:hypothetical protein
MTIWLTGCAAIVGATALFPAFELLDEVSPAQPAIASAARMALAWITRIGRRTGGTLTSK